MMDRARAQEASAELFGSDRMWGLKELPLPEPVSWWPQTPGWILLVAVAAILLAWAGHVVRRRYPRNAYRREGLAEIDAMKREGMPVTELPRLLRFSAIQAGQRNVVARLRGEEWIDWLNRSAGRELFVKDDAAVLDDLAYARDSGRNCDAAAVGRVLAASREWMRLHRAPI